VYSRPRALLAIVLTLTLSNQTFGDDLFSLTASGGGTTVTGAGSDVVDLAGDVIDSDNAFRALAGRSISGSLRYGGVNDAVLFSRNAAGTSATLTIPSTGFSKTFTAANEDDLEDQITDFFKDEGADAYADFLAEINKQTSLGVNDGNPLATTALLADLGFYRFGFVTKRPGDNAIGLPGGFDLNLSGGVQNFDDLDANGYYAQLGLAASFRLGDRVALSWANAFRYRDIEDAAVYQYGTTIALPVALITAPDGGLSWRLTPAFTGGFGGSWDLAAGGLLVGGQITSSASVTAGGWTVVLANQAGFYDGVPIDISDFRFETDTNQTILKNGVQVIRDLGDGAFVDVGVAYTNLLDDAFIEDYLSPSAGVGFRLGSGVLRFGYRGDFADDFTNHGGNVSLLFSY
jgi:hypothetical protein